MIEMTSEQVTQLATMVDPDAKPDFRIEDTNLRGVVAVTPMDHPGCGDGVGETTLIDSDGRVAILRGDEILPG